MSTVSYRVQLDSEIEQVDQVAWDGLCGKRSFATVHWLQLLERTMADYQPNYIQLWQGDELVAGAICQPQRHFHLSAYLKNRVLQKIAAKILAVLPPYACVLPLFLRDGFLVHPEVEAVVWLPLLLREIEKVARKRWAPFVYLGNLNRSQSSVTGQGAYRPVPILQDSYIDVAWDSYDAYLSHLKSKRRKIISVYSERAKAAGVIVQEIDFSSPLVPKMEALVRSVADKHNNAFLYQPNFLYQAGRHLNPNEYCVLVACIQDDLVGCVTLLRNGDELTAKWSGLDYGRTQGSYAYHYLVINVVKKAIELGVKRLDIGPTSYVIKRQMDAHFEDRFAGLKLGIRPFNAVLQSIANRPDSH